VGSDVLQNSMVATYVTMCYNQSARVNNNNNNKHAYTGVLCYAHHRVLIIINQSARRRLRSCKRSEDSAVHTSPFPIIINHV
jgi:hypothetical protein